MSSISFSGVKPLSDEAMREHIYHLETRGYNVCPHVLEDDVCGQLKIDDFEATVRYITTHTAPDERIVAFPYELAYYFYTERRSATRYSSAVSAVTREDRLAMIDELERVRPRYLIYSPGTPRIDGLKDSIVFPELTADIGRSYTPEQRFGKTWILRRREAVALPND